MKNTIRDSNGIPLAYFPATTFPHNVLEYRYFPPASLWHLYIQVTNPQFKVVEERLWRYCKLLCFVLNVKGETLGPRSVSWYRIQNDCKFRSRGLVTVTATSGPDPVLVHLVR